MEELRDQLVQVALAWERAFGNAPLITTVLSEYDAANSSVARLRPTQQRAVQKGHDFIFNGARYQVKGFAAQA